MSAPASRLLAGAGRNGPALLCGGVLIGLVAQNGSPYPWFQVEGALRAEFAVPAPSRNGQAVAA